MPTSAQPRLSRTQAMALYLLACGFLCYEMGLQVLPAVMTQAWMDDLHIGPSILGWVSGAYFVTYTLAQLFAGVAYDTVSRYLLTLVVIALCALGMMGHAFADAAWSMAVCRLAVGFGSAFAFIGVLVVAARYFPPHLYALLVGIAQALAALGAGLGSAPMAMALEHVPWRPLCLYLSLGGWVLLVLNALMRDQRPSQPHHAPFLQTWRHAFEGLGAVVRHAQAWWCGAYTFFNWASITCFAALWGTPFLAATYRVSMTQAAVWMDAVWVGVAVGAPILGALNARGVPAHRLMTFAGLLGTCATLLLLLPTHGSPPWLVVLTLAALGVGATGQILAFGLVRNVFPQQQVATAIGFVNMAEVAGGSLLQPLMGMLLAWAFHTSTLVPSHQLTNPASAHLYLQALWLMPVCFALSAWISRSKLRRIEEATAS